MLVDKFYEALERMRQDNLGKQLERRELGILASKYGIYINSNMWTCGLGQLFHKGKIGSKYVYIFKSIPITRQEIETLSVAVRAYKRDNNRKIEHAKAILRRFNIHNID